ncbi:DUF3105 domain-containing protein [Pseudonocardia sp.]|uniref:DUF3105 domain-containing protein n=1 Tax=Pseudonocardia sp. TaxID=60912 RepID=UPI002613F829|nr:DUF3105 domain-containing protein [Pseudonocardia sp.]
MASGKTSKRTRSTRSTAVTQRSIPWSTIIAVGVVVLFAAAVLGYVISEQRTKSASEAAVAAYTPSDENKDPSAAIPGVVTASYTGGQHIGATERVAYTKSPPFGGAHDFTWAACTGTVYAAPVRNENMVHSLEHGAVWIAYDPTKITGDGLAALRNRVEGKPYSMLSPYPGLDQPISLQSWGHQLKLSDPADPRIDQFIQSLRLNQFQHPEFGASCSVGPSQFNQDNPPPLVTAPAGPGAMPEAGRGAPAADENLPNG